ncbi:multiple sugar transport system substrate-binding protein [Paenibacillus mucilaginosus]|uniref:extracellular solute-binding protein n=1 Tax=Paenibacillus mucilaginosus TaxID=61624 RepID=UPI003D199C49
MTRRNRTAALAVLTLVTLLTASCGGTVQDSAAMLPKAAPLERAYRSVSTAKQLTIWTYYNITKDVERFRSEHPDVQVNVATFANGSYVEAYLDGLAGGSPPDLLLLDNRDIGAFNTIDGLEDLLQPPYGGQSYKAAIPGNVWKLYSSFDRERMISLPIELPTAATYYRRDLIESLGLPGDPAELGVYLENPEHWLELARKLKAQDRYIFQWEAEPVEVAAMQGNYLQEDLNFARNKPVYQQAMEVAKTVHREGLALRSSVQTDPGQEALRSGRLAMVYLGRWGADSLERWAPETKGLWSVTRLPMNLYGWNGGSSLAISSRSQSKELAWAFARMTTQLGAPRPDSGFLDMSPFDVLYTYGQTFVERQTPSPFDRKLEELWTESVTDILENGTHSGSGLRFIESQANSMIEKDRERLLRYLGKNKLERP